MVLGDALTGGHFDGYELFIIMNHNLGNNS